MNYTLDMFNSIRNDPLSGLSYLPEATVNNIQTIKSIINTDPKAYNSYVNAMLVRIGDVLIMSPDFIDPFARLYKGDNEMGHMVQEIYIEPIKAESNFDGKGLNPLGRRTNNNTSVVYHKTNYQPVFALSVDRVGMMDSFASWDMLDRYWGEQMRSMYTGEAIGRFNAELKVVGDAIADTTNPLPSATIGTFNAKDEASGKALAQAIKYVVNDLRFPNEQNQAGVVNVANKNDLVIVLNKDVEPNLDVYTLASLFNMEMAEIEQKIITVPSFNNASTGATNGNVIGLITTEKFFQFRRTMNTIRRQENAQGLFDNFFYHPWCSLQISPFAPAVVLRSGDAG